MKLSRAHFINELEKGLKGVYCLCADESIQIEELQDVLIDKAKVDGYEERVTHVVSQETDWSFLNSENDNLDSNDLLNSSEDEKEEDDLEIPAFLRRQKN